MGDVDRLKRLAGLVVVLDGHWQDAKLFRSDEHGGVELHWIGIPPSLLRHSASATTRVAAAAVRESGV